MNFFQRAIRNVTRRLSKSILLLITFFVIGNFVIIGLGVSYAAENAKVLTRKKMRAVVTLKLDYDAINKYEDSIQDQDEREAFQKNFPKIQMSDIEMFLNDPRVKAANAVATETVYQDSTTNYVHLNNEYEQNESENQNVQCTIMDDGTQSCMRFSSPTLLVKSNLFDNMIEFIDGKYKIVKGRFYTKDEIQQGAAVGLITQEFADENNLGIGDTMNIFLQDPVNVSANNSGITADDVRLEFEIIGIYQPSDKVTPATPDFNYMSPFENPANVLLIPATAMSVPKTTWMQKEFDHNAALHPGDSWYGNPENRPKDETLENIFIPDATLLIDDPLEVDQFVADYKDKLPQFKMLSANNDEFKRLSKPLDTLSVYSNLIVWLVVINAIVIITLVTALTLKTRQYEIGVLLSIGSSKLKIIAQFFCELAIVAIIGFTLATISGSMISKKVGQTVLGYQLAANNLSTSTSDMVDNSGNSGPVNNVFDTNYSTKITLQDLVDEYEVTISTEIIIQIYILGLLIVLISIIIPSLMIMRLNPKQIMLMQN